MYHDLTKGNISRSLLLFALPMMAGNLLQQFYNIADTLIVGRVLGRDALAAVGSAYTLMTFLTSIFLGLSLGNSGLIYPGISGTGRYSCFFKGARRSVDGDAPVSADHFCRTDRHLSLQFFCLSAACYGKFYGSSGISGGIYSH